MTGAGQRVRICREYFKQPSLANRINASGVFAKTAAKDLTGCRNIGWPLAARNSSYYSTNIADRKESLRTEWRRRHPDGSCNFDLNGRHAVRRSKCRRALGRLGSAERLRQARRGPPEAELSRPLLSCQGRPRCETGIVHPSRRIGSPSSRIYRECRNPYIPAMFQRMRTRGGNRNPPPPSLFPAVQCFHSDRRAVPAGRMN